MTQLVQYGEVKRGMLGVQLANQFTPDIAESLGLENARGALVSEVVEGGAADKAGIKAGDVITSINGRTIANASELRNSIGLLRIGDKSRSVCCARRQAAARDRRHRRARWRDATQPRRFIRRSKARRSRTPTAAPACWCSRSRRQPGRAGGAQTTSSWNRARAHHERRAAARR